MIRLEIFGDSLYFREESGSFGLDEQSALLYAPIPSPTQLAETQHPTCYSFSLNITNNCNLKCDYCFNNQKAKGRMTVHEAIERLDLLFGAFSDGEKYFVDLSGKGEPLLALDVVFAVSDYCHRKQDELRREILVQFATNGLLLTPKVGAALKKRGILFGVSLDGGEAVHDLHRKTANGEPTYQKVLGNVKSLENRDYLGCAVTLTKDVFSLCRSIDELRLCFRTISYRPARGSFGFDQQASDQWQREYEKLAIRLYNEGNAGDLSTFLLLMNGDDYFGRFLCRAFGNQIVINRCDGGITRFSVDLDGSIYPCAPASEVPSMSIGSDLRETSRENRLQQANSCAQCPYKFLCGGECAILLREYGRPHEAMCAWKRRLIILAQWIALRLKEDNPPTYERLSAFVEEKMTRYRADPALTEYLKHHPELSFTEAKKQFDDIARRY